MNKPITISTDQLRDILAEVRGAQPVTFTAMTEPEGKKAPFGKIRKLVRVNAMTGCRYGNAMAKAGDVAAEERSWGEHSQSALVVKAGKDGAPDNYYLPVQVNWVSRPLYLVAGPNGRLKAVPTDAVKPYLRPERPFAVTYKDYALKNITSMAQGGRRYRVRQGGST